MPHIRIDNQPVTQITVILQCDTKYSWGCFVTPIKPAYINPKRSNKAQRMKKAPPKRKRRNTAAKK